MGYKEKIQKYKDGTLSEDERRDSENFRLYLWPGAE